MNKSDWPIVILILGLILGPPILVALVQIFGG